MIQGKTNKEMAQALNICVKAIEKKIYNVYKKFSVRNRLRAVAHALQFGFEVKR
jgi:DNA-binding NarL/FixJ family response regulator